ncbi:autotransporter domain-containing protein [Sphingomonas sp. NSE70-1]|uniref:Autotransporter domain-containing protein n=1 Tax=Sphingomonas caseinilyticus TaxID=2908205 RepID=A0ABT0RVX1_9SPHN|nr:autotransporter domain-containing protein [Sphingomonas caseinilyticus]MCL6699185.1 autotransporter domain-containing protein [Sphingomonas caseinilyticus]
MTNRRLIALSLLAATALTATPAAAQRIDHIVAFGDSYADDGNAFQLGGIDPATTVVYTTGRFSGGTNYVDTLGSLLGVPIDNFAIGGAKTDNTNTSSPFLPGLTFEVTNFLGIGPQHPAFPSYGPTFGPNDLVTVSIGGNDARQYQQLGGTLAGAPTAAATAVTNATGNLNLLVGAGAQNISFLAGDTGRLPEIAGNPAGAAIRSAFSTAFNTGMQSTLAGYASNGVVVHYLDLNLLLDNVIASPAAYGITNGLACPSFPPPLGPPPGSTACIMSASGYLFYGDQLHLTSNGFEIVGRYIAAQLTAPLTLQAASDLGLDVAHQFGRTLTARMDTTAPRDGDMPEGLKFFVAGDGYSRKLDAGARNDEYRSSGVGITAGAEYGFGSGLVGVALNYSKPKVNFGNDAADNEAKSLQLGGYGAFGIAGGFLQAYAGYGWDDHEIERVGVVEGMEADPDGDHLILGAKAGYLMPMGSVRVGPVIALDYAKADVDSYTETGDPVLTLNVDSLSYKSLRGSVGVEVRGDFEGGGAQLRPFASAVIEKDFTGDERTVRFSQTSAPTIVNSFELQDGSKDAYGRLSLGFSAAILESVSLDVAGSATVGKDQGEETSANVGFRFSF